MNNLQGQVILVNEKDEWQGTMEKMQAHKQGALHRAFSVFILNDKNEMLLQQRALNKYHSPGLWSNTCCSHPMPGESTLAAAHRRLKEEMGFDCALEAGFTYRYKADVGDTLIENEFDHIYTGRYDGPISINKEEANDYSYIAINEIEQQLKNTPSKFTAWFRLLFPQFLHHLQSTSFA
jgi:isopentenyl-diphosphate Delta-isomerase